MIPGIAPTSIDTVSAGLSQIKRIADPDRMRRLDGYERLWKGLAYAGRPSFWDVSVPIAERAPCVTSGLPEASIRRLSALVFGARQFPTITTGNEELNAALKEIGKAAKLSLRMRKALEQGLALGTVCLILGLVEGCPCVSVMSAKLATPVRSASGVVLSLEIKYRYDGKDENGNPITLWYRRVIDDTRDVVYQPAIARDDGWDPVWVEDPERSINHNLGFCPVIWHRHDEDPSDSDGHDGTPLFAGMEDELEALDFALSQHHRNGRYNGEPQMVVSGASKIDAETGREQKTSGPAPVNGKNPAFSWFDSLTNRNRGGASATKKAPGKVWYLEDASASANLLESSGSGANVLREDAAQLRRAILEAKSIVIASPEEVSANASAALMEALHAPMIDHADTLRTEYEPVLVSVITMLLRMCGICESRATGSVRIKNIAPALPHIKALPDVDIVWGRYYEPTLQDISQGVSAATSANGGKPVLSQRSSIKMLSSFVNIASVDGELEQIEAESAPKPQVIP